MAAKKPAKATTKKRAGAKRPAAREPPKKAASKAAAGDAGRGEVAAWLRGFDDWRGEALTKLRALILEAVPDVEEAIKWRKPTNPDGVPVWSHGSIFCTGGVYKEKVKLTFAEGAALPDPHGVFNAMLDAGTWRAIDLREGETVDEKAFRALVRAAAERAAG